MKKQFLLLTFIALLLFSNRITAQAFNFSVTPQNLCLNSNAIAVVTATAPLASTYTWVVAAPGLSQAIVANAAPNGSAVSITFTACGIYTVACFAFTTGSIQVGQVSNTVFVSCNTANTPTIISTAANSTLCSGSSVTLTGIGGTTYTWFPGSITGPSIVVTPVSNTCYTLVASNVGACNSMSTSCVSILPSQTLVISGPNNLCTGGVATLVAAGAASYTWQPGNLTGNSIVVSPSVSTCYTVVAANPNGCTTASVHCITVAPSLNVLAVANTTVVCAGSSANLSAAGAATYTWFPGSQTGANIVVTPTVSTCYTVTGSSGPGCNASAAICIIVNPVPAITVGPTNTICPGGTVSLMASGATSYTWNVGSMLNPIIVSPLTSTCYSVIGSGPNGCVGMAVSCVSVAVLPPITISASSANGSFVCEGSTLTYTASGALSYSWSGGSTSPTYSMIAGTLANYTNLTQTVTGLFANGCLGTATVSPWLLTHTCSNVWPGDANRDGVVSNTDVFEIGLAFNATGPARTSTSNAWASQFANNWTGTISTGWNRNHADCNGNGTINNADTVAIFNNFSLTHAFKASENNAVNPDITLTLPATVYAGQWNKADILLGSASAPISQLYGIAFDLGIDQTLLDNNSAYLLYTPSFLNANNQNVEFRKNNLTSGLIHAASVRVDGNNSNGNGKIGELWFKLSATAPNNALLNLSANNGVKINSSGTSSALTTGTASAVVAIDVGVKESGGLLRNLSVYPNPASNQVSLQNTSGFSVAYSIVDILGREVLKGEFVGIKTLDVSSLGQGAYFIKFESAGTSVHKKLVIEKR